MQKINTSLDEFIANPKPNLYAVAGLAVSDNGTIEYKILNDRQPYTMVNRMQQNILPDCKSATCIKEIHLSTYGVLIKIEGPVTRSVIKTISVLTQLMQRQKMSASYFPAISHGRMISICVSGNYERFSEIESTLADAVLCDEQLIFRNSHDQFTLRKVAFKDVIESHDFRTVSGVQKQFATAIRGLGRWSIRLKRLPVNFVDGHVIELGLTTNTNYQVNLKLKPNQLYMGRFRIREEIDHALALITDYGEMFLSPMEPATCAVISER
jgi:hypothetical protein